MSCIILVLNFDSILDIFYVRKEILQYFALKWTQHNFGVCQLCAWLLIWFSVGIWYVQFNWFSFAGLGCFCFMASTGPCVCTLWLWNILIYSMMLLTIWRSIAAFLFLFFCVHYLADAFVNGNQQIWLVLLTELQICAIYVVL